MFITRKDPGSWVLLSRVSVDSRDLEFLECWRVGGTVTGKVAGISVSYPTLYLVACLEFKNVIFKR